MPSHMNQCFREKFRKKNLLSNVSLIIWSPVSRERIVCKMFYDSFFQLKRSFEVEEKEEEEEEEIIFPFKEKFMNKIQLFQLYHRDF